MWPLKRKPKIPEKIFETELLRIQDIIAPSAIEVSSNFLKIGERLAKTYFIFSFPRYLSAAWSSSVINLAVPLDIAIHIHPIETGPILRQLRKRVTEVQAEVMEREEKGLVREPELEIAYRDLEELRDRLQTAQEKMFRLSLYLTVYGDNDKELRDTELTLRSIFEARLIYIKPALFQQKEGFISTSPYGLDVLMIHTAMNTEPLSSVFPFVSFDLSANEGILYGINRHNNSLVLFDRFSLENANMTVFGIAGSGKSVLEAEPVLIKDRHKIRLVKIGSLVESLIKKQGAIQIDEELEGIVNPGIEVYSFDKNLKGEWSKVTVAARKKAPEVFYKFITRSGREITTTGDHNMLVLKNGKLMAAKSSEMKEGEFIPLPRSVSGTQKSLTLLNLLNLLKDSKNIYILGAKDLIRSNYKILKKTKINNTYDRYLYKYRDGQVVPIKYFQKILKYLSVGLNDPEVKKIKLVSKNSSKKYSLGIDFPITPEFLRVAGFITAEGTVTKRAIRITNSDPEALKEIDFSLKKLGIPFYYGNRGIIIASRLFIEIIKALGGKGKSKQKKVWPFIFNLEKEKVAQYLSAYFEGDGGAKPHRVTVTTSSRSRRLISEIAYLLYYFGIVSRLSRSRKRTTSYNWGPKRLYWKITISGQDNLKRFAENINFISKRKREQLTEIIMKKGNTNVDLVPGLGPVFQEIYQLFPPLLHGFSEVGDWKIGRRNPSPHHLLKVVNKIEEKIQYFKDLTSTFKVLSKLPELKTIIDFGKNNKKINQVLWQVLGQSWRMIKNEEVRPGSVNVFKALKVINGNSYSVSVEEVKSAIHRGFREMNLPIKHFNHSFQTALVHNPHSSTDYQAIQRTAQFIWQNYQEILNNKIPHAEERLMQLKILANSDLLWDPIKKIEKIKNKKEKYVYDLTVDNEVFLAGQGGMFVHNSYAVKLEILRSLMVGVDIIILDPENEYEFLSDTVGGSYFKISLTAPYHINPFDLPVPREDERAEDVFRSNIINLVGLLRIMLGGLTPEEDAIIDTALTETYAAKDITPESDFSKITPPLMSDLEEVLEGMEGTESLVRRLRKFTRGTYAGFFNQPTDISMENRFVVFGIRDMEEELRPMAMYIIMRYIWNAIRAELKKRILVIDEAWWLMRTEDGASFLFGLAKRARKYWLGLTTITQDVPDFMRSTYGQPIITNSALQLLMKTAPAAVDVVQKAFNLTEEEKLFLMEAAVGEGLFFAGSKHVLLGVQASYTEDQIITTAPEEVLKIRKAKKELEREI